MLNFWENIVRYPRFLISSLLGLVFIITEPFQKLLKTFIGKFLFILIFLGSFLFIRFIFENMLDI
jgi:hypothetical protein